MNRGKTALKRGVAVASVAAMAIAGAVLAAPAASAAVASPGGIRATPTADAAWVDGTGALATSATAGQTYNTTNAAAGTAKLLSGTNQLANGIQVALFSNNSGTSAWNAGNLTIKLANAEWNTTPSIAISPLSQLTGAGGVDYVAGFNGTHATAAPVISVANSAVTQTSGATIATDTLTIPLSADPHLATATGQGYIVTLSGVKVNVNATAVPTQAITATAALSNPSTSLNATTIGYVGGATLSVPANATVATGATGSLALPTLTMSETSPGAFENIIAAIGQPVKFVLSTDKGTTLKFDMTSAPSATVTGSTATVAASLINDTTLGVTLTSGDANALESITISGLKIVGSTLPGNATNVLLTVAQSTTGATNTSSFSFAPNFGGVVATIPVSRPDRIAGANRYATAAAIANMEHPTGGATAVILANGLNAKEGVDALSANFVAGQKSAPILLTDSSSTLPAETQAAIKSLFKGSSGTLTLYVMGKTDSVSQAARDQAALLIYGTANSGSTVNVVEVAGSSRYATSAAAASQPGVNVGAYSLTTGANFLKTAFLASGTTNADALAAGSLSAFADIPVLLTSGTALDQTVKDAINNLGIQQVIVLGKSDRVSDAVVKSLTDLGVTNTIRIAGNDRYATAAALYTFAYGTPTATVPGLSQTFGGSAAGYVANGDLGWPDALTVGPLAGMTQSPVLTTGTSALAPDAATFLKANKASLGQIWAVGGVDRVPATVLTAAEAAIS